MSATGEYRLEMERRRREEIRRRRLQTELDGQLGHLNAALCEVQAPGLASWLKTDRQAIQARRQRIAARPTTTAEITRSIEETQAATAAWAVALTGAQAKAEAWSAQRAACQAQIEAMAPRVAVATSLISLAGQAQLQEAKAALTRGRAAAMEADEAGVEAAMAAIEVSLAAADQAEQVEAERKATVAGLMKILSGMGFIAARPKRRAEDDVVVLEGRLPSGRQARFEIQASGALEFDLHGYPGRDCKADLDHVGVEMERRFGVRFAPQQFRWSNPDRDLKEAKSRPEGTGRGRVRRP